MVTNTMNYKNKVTHSETNNLHSLTLQGENTTVRELLQRHVQGELLKNQKEAIYDSPEDHDDIDETRIPGFDLIDAIELKEEIDIKKQMLAEALEAEELAKTTEGATPPSSETEEADLQEVKTKNIEETATAGQQIKDEKTK